MPSRLQRGGGGAGVPQLDQQGDEGASGQDGLDAAFLDVLDSRRGAEVAVVDGQGSEPLPGIPVRDEFGGGHAGGLEQQDAVGDPRVLRAG